MSTGPEPQKCNPRDPDQNIALQQRLVTGVHGPPYYETRSAYGIIFSGFPKERATNSAQRLFKSFLAPKAFGASMTSIPKRRLSLDAAVAFNRLAAKR
jgi:hypothetical protein